MPEATEAGDSGLPGTELLTEGKQVVARDEDRVVRDETPLTTAIVRVAALKFR